MLKIYCVCPHIESFASAVLATPPVYPRRHGRFEDGKTVFVVSVKEFTGRQQETRG